ncbi:protein kinase domain-containing protein [Cellulomonas septica]|uniref:protein kinase domain-containing protein n=1 Tax=Cellulomonas septica TaxID=285080 RepID=UPI001445F5F4|nr:hypothetical protein [Cellulomonas septica]
MFDADALIGETLGGQWTIESRLPPASTGGNFSVGFLGSTVDGRRVFIKVLNFDAAFRSADPTGTLQWLTEAYNFERDLVERCGSGRLSRVVMAYGHGTEQSAASPLPTSYIVFEPADFDVRRALDLDRDIDMSAKLRMAHHAASGLQQLHGLGIAHQDVKPSNLLVFSEPSSTRKHSKLSDLGRASDRETVAWHDSFTIAGDRSYAPPEQLYGEVYSSFAERRIACDIYQLGNLVAFIMTGVTINARLKMHLHPSYSPENWGGTYGDVLPYVTASHVAAVEDVETEIAHPLAREIASIIRCTTDPDVGRRGHPASRAAREPFALNRLVTELDLLAHRAELLVRRATR